MRLTVYLLGLALTGLSTIAAYGEAFPTRNVTIIVPFAAGGPTDVIMRILGERLSARWGKPVIVENRPGAGGNIALEAVGNAAPDGYTLLFATSANVLAAAFYSKSNVDFARDIAPVTTLVRGPLVMEVNPSFPATTIPEFIAYAKANPGRINMASAGIGNTTHVAGELFQMLTGTKFTHVPYRGGAPAVADLIGGQVQVYFDGISGSLDFIRGGTLRALGVTTVARADVLPNVPTIAEFVPGYEAAGWYGVGAPRQVPAEIIERLNREINAALADPKLKTRLADLGYVTFGSSSAEFADMIAHEIDKWTKVIKFAGIKPD